MANDQIDLKHYKSRRLALRWRTAEEVVEGLGEDTCASLRCKYHPTPSYSTVQIDGERRERKRIKRIPKLRAFELPFVYVEMGERREALVKVRLCGRCEGKLTWKPDTERASKVEQEQVSDEDEDDESSEEERVARKESRRRREGDEGLSRYRPRSRSKSPKRSHSPRRDRHLV
jgi:protein FRA10AC1